LTRGCPAFRFRSPEPNQLSGVASSSRAFWYGEKFTTQKWNHACAPQPRVCSTIRLARLSWLVWVLLA
jgi:hypothetical protein